MYVTSSYNRLFALDAKTGELLWRYDHQNGENLRLCCGPPNRGVGIAGDLVIMGTLDAKLIAFDRKTGEIAWNIVVADYTGASASPRRRSSWATSRSSAWPAASTACAASSTPTT